MDTTAFQVYRRGCSNQLLVFTRSWVSSHRDLAASYDPGLEDWQGKATRTRSKLYVCLGGFSCRLLIRILTNPDSIWLEEAAEDFCPLYF